MTGVPAAQPGQDKLTPRIFRALYAEFDLHTIGGTHVAVPKGTPWFSGRSLGEIARQISEYQYPHADRPPASSPAGPT